MGFFGTLGRIIQGKPVFEVKPPETPQQTQQVNEVLGTNQANPTEPQPQSQPVAPAGPKVYPRVYIERVECQISGGNMDVDFFIQNDSERQVDVDRLELLGRSQDLGTFLRPGEERQFRVYNGPRPTSTSMSRVVLYFKDQTVDNDLFRSEHTLEFKQEADGTYSPNRIRFLRVDDV